MREHGEPGRRPVGNRVTLPPEQPATHRSRCPGEQFAGNKISANGAQSKANDGPLSGAQPAAIPKPAAESLTGCACASAPTGTGQTGRKQTLKPPRSAALSAFVAGLLLMGLAFAGPLLWGGTSYPLFSGAINATLVSDGVLTQRDADAFAAETVAYLTGAKPDWQPAVTLGGQTLAVPEAFRAHMATVRGWVRTIGAAYPALAGLALLLLLCAVVIARRKPGNHFPTRAYRWGALLPLALLAGACLWAMLDFAGLWAWLHETFIPDGIFPAGEAIMQLFPIALFQRYLAPIGGLFLLCAAAVLALPALLRRLAFSDHGRR